MTVFIVGFVSGFIVGVLAITFALMRSSDD